MKLSLLIPTLPQRDILLKRLARGYLNPQVNALPKHLQNELEVLIRPEVNETIGTKRNNLLSVAKGDYIAFIDDDDRISMDYLSQLFRGIEQEPDCMSLQGVITTNYLESKPFYHSIAYDEMYESAGVYYRPPNHLNCVKRELALQCPFPDWKASEDSNYCFQLRDKGLLKKEYKTEGFIYFYDFFIDKRDKAYSH